MVVIHNSKKNEDLSLQFTQESEPIFIVLLAKPSGTSSSSVYTAKFSQGYLNKRGGDMEKIRERDANTPLRFP